MKGVARRSIPTTLECIYDRRLTHTWDSDEILFVLESPKVRELAELGDGEFVVYHPNLEYPCVALKKDWEIL